MRCLSGTANLYFGSQRWLSFLYCKLFLSYPNYSQLCLGYCYLMLLEYSLLFVANFVNAFFLYRDQQVPGNDETTPLLG